MTNSAIFPSLKGRTVFVSGGATGIGAEIITHFAEQGAQTAFVDIDEASSAALVDRLGSRGLPVPMAKLCDVRDVGALRSAIAAVADALGPITTLVNSAASDDPHWIDDVEPDYWDERMARNLRHYFFASQAVRQGMKDAGGGSIVNLGSIVWLFGAPKCIAYSTAKAAISGMTRSMARELGPENIRVNCVIPGWVMTRRQLDNYINEAAERQISERQCLPRRVEPSDIANMVLFLAADESRCCTSQQYVVDCGWT